jgi:kynurenine formamidase
VKRWVNRPPGSNWGDFGDDDQRGRMNLLTPDKVISAAREIKLGKRFCLSLPLDMPGGSTVNPKRYPPRLGPVFDSGRVYHNFVADSSDLSDVTSDECVTLYSQYSTQWDSLAHVGMMFDADNNGVAEKVYYNGYRAYEHIGGPQGSGELGARALSIDNMAVTGVQGRAVMVDLKSHVGTERVAVDHELLQSIMRRNGITVEEGDFLLLHTGWDDMILSMNGSPDAQALHGACAVLDGYDTKLLQWITDSGLVAIATDNMAVEDSRSVGDADGGMSRLPLHRHCLFRLGIHLGELWHLSELAAALAEAQRYRCFLTAPPWRLPGAVGSPVTPVATI